MPHGIIEYSKEISTTIPIRELVNAVHAGAFESGLFEESSIKTRAIAYEDYQIGSTDSLFVHITARILYGRNHQQKKALSQLLLARVESLLVAPVCISVEIVDIDKVSYSKVVL
jgi:5-carboxymethyl-2-hydroxymuconate isomerase